LRVDLESERLRISALHGQLEVERDHAFKLIQELEGEKQYRDQLAQELEGEKERRDQLVKELEGERTLSQQLKEELRLGQEDLRIARDHWHHWRSLYLRRSPSLRRAELPSPTLSRRGTRSSIACR